MARYRKTFIPNYNTWLQKILRHTIILACKATDCTFKAT
jgi:hypothetical protein